ncbi:MAG TPA: hypothetical protein VME46_10715 [Acidimicrobiales bacterium]|nr:hypothetical protein [Acidimicrobiales bacterium]
MAKTGRVAGPAALPAQVGRVARSRVAPGRVARTHQVAPVDRVTAPRRAGRLSHRAAGLLVPGPVPAALAGDPGPAAVPVVGPGLRGPV